MAIKIEIWEVVMPSSFLEWQDQILSETEPHDFGNARSGI